MPQNDKLSYQNFKSPFDVRADASDFHLGLVVVQYDYLLEIYLQKVTPVKRGCAVGER